MSGFKSPSFPSPLITRFAPSPTGLLHLGHVANAVYVWGIAGARVGKVNLRLEDHDRGRFRPAYEEAILRDLEWLGFEPNVNSIQSFRDGSSPFRQSDRLSVYDKFARQLKQRNLAYPCECTRSEITAESGAHAGEEPMYTGRCRDRRLEDRPGLGLRVKMPDEAMPFIDLNLGPQTQNPQQQCGDMLIRDRSGNWTYQFCVTVDDLQQDITTVIRGQDLLSSTGRQLALRSLLGAEKPMSFFHHGLIKDHDGRKLSKRDGDLGLETLRASGFGAEEILGRVAFLVGLLGAEQPIAAKDVAELF